MQSRFLLCGGSFVLACTWILAHGNEPRQAKLEVQGGQITIDYSAPTLQGRDLNELIKLPGANPWRLGADRPTQLSTPVSLKFGDSPVPAGRYRLRAYLDGDGNWWLQAYDSSRAIVGKIQLSSSTAETSEEHLLISLHGTSGAATIQVQWGKNLLQGQFAVAP
ncbi:MAG: DUF2911 domain-containing protein [Acidobacteriota bacterium]